MMYMHVHVQYMCMNITIKVSTCTTRTYTSYNSLLILCTDAFSLTAQRQTFRASFDALVRFLLQAGTRSRSRKSLKPTLVSSLRSRRRVVCVVCGSFPEPLRTCCSTRPSCVSAWAVEQMVLFLHFFVIYPVNLILSKLYWYIV